MSEKKKGGGVKPTFAVLLMKRLAKMKKISDQLAQQFQRAGKPTIYFTSIVEALGNAADAIKDLPADFKPAKAAGAATFTVGLEVEIVPKRQADFSGLLGEAVAAGRFEVTAVDERKVAVKSKVNPSFVTFFVRRDVQIPGTIRKERKVKVKAAASPGDKDKKHNDKRARA